MNSPEKSSIPTSATEAVRIQAEATLQETGRQSDAQHKLLPPDQVEKLIHDLHVHQIELEMQNEELRRAKLELEISKANYFDLYDRAPVGYTTISDKGLLLMSNLTFATMVGVPRGAVVGKSFFSFAHAESTDHCYFLCKHVHKTGEPRSADIRLLKRDGSEFWVQLDATRAADEGASQVVRVTISEITSRKRAETALRDSDTFYSSILNSVADHIAVLNGESVILFVNRAWGQVIEDDFDKHVAVEIVGQNYLQACVKAAFAPPSEETAKVLLGLKAVLAGTEQSFQLEYPCHSLTEHRWFLMTITRLVGSRRAVVISHKNTTELRQAEQALRLSEARTIGIVASAMDAIISVNERQCVVLFNAAAERMFGYREVEVLGQSLDRFIPVRHQARHHRQVVGFGGEGVTSRSMGSLGLVSGVRANGEEFPVEASISVVNSGDDKIYTVILRDVTERIRLEAEREAIEVRLRQAQKMEALGTMAGGIAHDFNNILAGISGFSTLARGAVGDFAEQVDYFNEIDRAAQRAAKLVSQILTFSRADKNALVPIKIGNIVAEAVQLLKSTVPSWIEVVVDIEPNLPAVLGNSTQVHQIVMNLGTNAAYALGKGGCRLSIKLEACTVTNTLALDLTDLSSRPCVRLTVSDTGCGMDAATRLRIFEPFFTTKAQGEGTGLGLSVLHGIVHNHRGAILVHSEVGCGTTFEIILPSTTEAVVNKDEAALEMLPRGSGERILFLDDEEPLARLGALTAVQLGYTAERETNPLTALARIKNDPQAFHLVVTDQTMPALTGLEFATQIHAFRPELPVIVASGYSVDLTPEAVRAAGVTEVLAKPFTKATLAAAIRRQLSSKLSF